jgi:hypothetical protein
MLYVAFLPQVAFCFPLTLPSPFSVLLCHSPLVLVIDIDPECRLNSHKIGVFLPFKIVFILHSAVILRGVGKSNTSAIWRGNKNGRAQNVYVLRDIAGHFCSQHN